MAEQELRKFRAIRKGYYDDVMRDPDGKHAIFEAPADFTGSWAVPVDDDVEVPDDDKPEDGTVLSEVKLRSEGPDTTVEQYRKQEIAEADVETL